MWTTAADATFEANSTRGDADVSNVVDAVRGEIVNVINFKSPTRALDQLAVRLSATATSDRRVSIVFRNVKVRFAKRFLGIFKTLTIPVPAPTITRILFFFKRDKTPPLPFFDLLYLDEDLRIQRTGEGNIFVQRRIPPALTGF